MQLLRQQARERLESEQGRYYRARRPVKVESVFAQIKHNRQFRRFLLRGLEKVNIEYRLAAIAHNLINGGNPHTFPPISSSQPIDKNS
ncbi:transposase [bacterium]|nr:transposase [bacterium]